jgi:hypothetical protein
VSAINDGGPAFPLPSEPGFPAEMGMTLRDWFAGQALGAYLAGRNGDSRDTARPHVAQTCYEYADAMLKAREVEP